MRFRPHRIGDDVLTALAAGGGGAEAARLLAGVERSVRLLLLRAVVERAHATGHPRARSAAEAYDRLAAIQDEHPRAVERALGHPSVGAWVRRTVLTLDRDPRSAEPDRLAAVTATAAIHAGTRLTIDVPVRGGFAVLPGLGRARLSGRTATVRSAPHGAEVTGPLGRVEIPANPHTDAPGWQGLRRMTAHADGRVLTLLLDDIDPYRMPADVTDRLTPGKVADWSTTLRSAWEVLTRHHRLVAQEVQTLIRVLTPLNPAPRGLVSATATETFGATALSEPPDGVALAVTFAHEVQHAKLGALITVLPLIRPDAALTYYAPWRDDPRPASGLLQGAYAHLGVAGFWRRRRLHEYGEAAIRAHAQFARWRSASYGAARALLSSGVLTAAGERFVDGMRDALAAWQHEAVPPVAAKLARAESDAHLTRWKLRNGEIDHLGVATGEGTRA